MNLDLSDSTQGCEGCVQNKTKKCQWLAFAKHSKNGNGTLPGRSINLFWWGGRALLVICPSYNIKGFGKVKIFQSLFISEHFPNSYTLLINSLREGIGDRLNTL
jgi:hypothetical protein